MVHKLRDGAVESLASEHLVAAAWVSHAGGTETTIGWRANGVHGLGLGFTLRAALRCFAPDSEIVVAELVPEIVE